MTGRGRMPEVDRVTEANLNLRFDFRTFRGMSLSVGSMAVDAVRLDNPGAVQVLCVHEAEVGQTQDSVLIDLLKGAGALGLGVVGMLPDGTKVMLQVIDEPEDVTGPSQGPDVPPPDPGFSGDREPRVPITPVLSPGEELVEV